MNFASLIYFLYHKKRVFNRLKNTSLYMCVCVSTHNIYTKKIPRQRLKKIQDNNEFIMMDFKAKCS